MRLNSVTRSLAYLIVVLSALHLSGRAALADRVFTGNVSGYYTLYDEDVYFEGDVYLVGDLTIVTHNGNIYTHDCNFIDGSGASGQSGSGGQYIYNSGTDSYDTVPPEPGVSGGRGFNLTLKALIGEPFDSTNNIYMEAPISLTGGNGGSGGDGAPGLLANNLDPCVFYPPMNGASGGLGGIGGSVLLKAAGDIYWEGDVFLDGGLGGQGGDGGAGGYVIIGPFVPAGPVAGSAGGGGIGGSGGDVSFEAGGDLVLTGSIGVYSDGQRGGRGGDGGGDAGINKPGGDGGDGGDGGTLIFLADNIGPDSGSGYGAVLSARSGVGGAGGHGGDGTYEYFTCYPNGGCAGGETVIRGPGRTGGSAGSVGIAGIIDIRVPIGTSGIISLNGLEADARPVTYNSAAGPAGEGGVTQNAECAECDFAWAAHTPAPGQLGTIGGHGGLIYFECYTLNLIGCDLDVRGGKGGNGGLGGRGECEDALICAGATGGSGGVAGQGGHGGNIWYVTNTINAAGGIARRCSGAGGVGGDGGIPGGSGGAGASNGSIGTIYNYASYGTPPANMFCINSSQQSGDDGDGCSP